MKSLPVRLDGVAADEDVVDVEVDQAADAGGALPGGTAEMVAVKVTGWPKTRAWSSELKAMLVSARLTVCWCPGREVGGGL